MGDTKESKLDIKRKFNEKTINYNDIDLYSGKTLKTAFEFIDKFSRSADTGNLELLVDVYRENYKSLNNSTDFCKMYG